MRNKRRNKNITANVSNMVINERRHPFHPEKYVFKAEKLSNRNLIEVLPDNSWKDKDCYIIGGGPSLEDFDWSLLKGKRTIGINRVFEKFDPTIIFSMDTRYLNWILQNQYGVDVRSKFQKSKTYKVWLCTYTCKLPEKIFIIPVYVNYSKGFKAFPTTMKDGIGHGNNSGYGALNLAVCLGVKRIYLLGFDMKIKDKKTHWHDGHKRPMKPTVLESYKKYFKHAANEIKKKTKIKVINLNPDSALNCFPRKHYKEVLH